MGFSLMLQVSTSTEKRSTYSFVVQRDSPPPSQTQQKAATGRQPVSHATLEAAGMKVTLETNGDARGWQKKEKHSKKFYFCLLFLQSKLPLLQAIKSLNK